MPTPDGKTVVSPVEDTAMAAPGRPTDSDASRSVGEAFVHNLVHANLFGDQPTATKVGRFVLLEKLGAGAMGAVYAAYDETLDRKVAIKLLHHRSAAADHRLLAEARSLARVVHPGVVAVHEVGDDPGGLYLAMEFVRGVDLREWMQEPRTWQQCLGVFLQAGRGLAAAHAAGVIHRDFKPANVLLGDDGRARVVDFGLASARADDTTLPSPHGDALVTTASGKAMGTPAYMAMECWEGRSIDARSDQFSFCVSLFEAIYGARPFRGETPQELALAIHDEAVTVPAHLDRAPRWLHQTLVRGLRSDGELRWPSMNALLDALEQRRHGRGRWVSLALVGGAVGASGIAGIVGLGARDGDTPCQGGKAQREAGWGAARQSAIALAFARAKPDYGRQASAMVMPVLDAYAKSWEAVYTDLCEATHVRGELAQSKLDVRMRCLQRRWRRLDKLASVFEHADADVVGRAAEATQSLPAPSDCEDADVGRSGVPEPPPDVQADVEQVRLALEDVEALLGAGRYDQAGRAAEQALIDAGKTEYRPVVAEATRELGVAQSRNGAQQAAAQNLSESYYLAYAAGDDNLARTAALNLVYVHGNEEGGLEDALRWSRLAQAGLARDDAGPAQWGELWSSLGTAHLRGGQIDAAVDFMQRAVDADPDGDQPLRRATVLNNLGVVLSQSGQTAAGAEALREAVALRTEHQGDAHPQALQTRHMLATVLGNTSEHDEAEAAFTDLLQHYERTLGADALRVAEIHNNRGIARNNAGQHALAIEDHQRALTIREAKLAADDMQIGYSLLNLGVAERRLGQGAQATAHAQRALAILTAALSPDDQRLATPHRNLGSLYEDAGESERAIESYRRAIAVLLRGSTTSTTLASVRNDLANVLRDQGRVDDALIEHDAAKAQLEALDPVPPEVLVAVLSGRAETLLRLGRVDEANADAQRALALAVDDEPKRKGDALRILALVQHARGARAAEVGDLVERAANAYLAAPPHARSHAELVRQWWRDAAPLAQ